MYENDRVIVKLLWMMERKGIEYDKAELWERGVRYMRDYE